MPCLLRILLQSVQLCCATNCAAKLRNKSLVYHQPKSHVIHQTNVNGKSYYPRHSPDVATVCRIVAIILDLCTLLSLSSTCGTVSADSVDFSSFASFKRTVRQIDFTSFYLVSRLRFTGLLLVPLQGFLIYSHIVTVSRTAVSFNVCTN